MINWLVNFLKLALVSLLSNILKLAILFLSFRRTRADLSGSPKTRIQYQDVWRANDAPGRCRHLINMYLPGNALLEMDDVYIVAYHNWFGVYPTQEQVKRAASAVYKDNTPFWLQSYQQRIRTCIDENNLDFLDDLHVIGINFT